MVIYQCASQGDKRYTTFDHVPEQRERWLRVRIWLGTTWQCSDRERNIGIPVTVIRSEIVCACGGTESGVARFWGTVFSLYRRVKPRLTRQPLVTRSAV